jgi:hypothetical protein
MKKVVLFFCIVALLISAAQIAMASEDYWVVKFRAGFYDGAGAVGNDTLVIGAAGVTASTPDTFVSTIANIASISGSSFLVTQRVAPVAGSPYTFNLLLAPGADFTNGTGPNAGKVFISAWTPENYIGTPGRSLPYNWIVRVQGVGVDVTWTYADLYRAVEPATAEVGPVGFWYDFGARSTSYTDENANDFFTVTFPTPEPGSLMALSSGLIGFAGYAIRRRKA